MGTIKYMYHAPNGFAIINGINQQNFQSPRSQLIKKKKYKDLNNKFSKA